MDDPDRSLLALKLGADWSFEASPENWKLICPLELELELELLAEEPLVDPDEAMLEGRRSIQGTATCLPLLLADEPLLPVVALEVELALELGLVLELVSLDPLLPPVTESIANSTRPEVGLMITSCTVPRDCPEELVTWAPSSCVARRCCPCEPILPVALSPEPSELEPCWLELDPMELPLVAEPEEPYELPVEPWDPVFESWPD